LLRVLFAILLLGALISCAVAQPAEAEQSRGERELRQVLFSSAEFAGGTTFIGSGFKRAAQGSVDAQGFILMSLSGAGATPEIFRGPADTSIRVARVSTYGSVLVGYQWMRPGAVFMLAAGPEIASRQVIDDRGRPRWQPRQTGARLIAETWLEPTPQMIAQATLILSSAQNSLWSRASTGIALAPGMYLGPEAGIYVEPGYREARLGAHLTGLVLGPLTFRLNAGVTAVAGERSGFYLGLGAYFKR
jgi:hypothetical protein